MATNLYIEVANRKGIASPSDHNPIVPPDLSPPGTYQFNLYFLDLGNPDTYHRYSSAAIELGIRQNGPPISGTFTASFLGYTTSPLDISSTSADDLQAALEALPSVRPGNVKVTGNSVVGFAAEFIGNRGGLAQQPITCDASGCQPLSTAVVKQTVIGGIGGSNSKQLILISQDRVAVTNTFAELTASSFWGWATSGGLSTAGISQAFWNSPAYDVCLEVKLFIAGARAGTDGITSQLAARSGSDGVTTDHGRARSGTDGVVSQSAGRSGIGFVSRSTTFLVYSESSPIDSHSAEHGDVFVQGDAGRIITDNIGAIPAGTKIDVVGAGSGYTYAQLNAWTKDKLSGGGTAKYYARLTWTTSALVSTQFVSATASFTQADVGAAFSGPNIPAGTTIVQVINSTTVILSQAPTSGGSGLSWSVGSQPSTAFSSATGAFTSADIGRAISGTNIPSGATIATVIDSTHITLSQPALAAGTGENWSIPAQISPVYQSATAAFVSGDVGKILSGPNVPTNTTILSVIDSTHCQLSQLPTAAATGLSWTILSTDPGSSGNPVVTDIQVGDSANSAIQQISFAEVPDYGSFTLQDGAGGQPVTGAIAVPLNAPQIEDALNTAYPAKSPFSVKLIAPTIFQVTFGVTGAQSHLIVDDTAVFYDHVVLRLVLVPGVGVSGGPGGTPTAPPIIYDGDFSREIACGPVREESIPNTGGARMYRQRFSQLAVNRRGRPLNSGGPFGSYLIGASGCQDVGGGVVEWDYVWVTLPPNRVDAIFAGRTYQGLAKTFSGSTLVDQQIWSISVTQRMTRYRSYSVGYPGWNSGGTPAGIIIHYINGQSLLLGFNGFQTGLNGTFYAAWNWSINIQRWLGDLWEMETVQG